MRRFAQSMTAVAVGATVDLSLTMVLSLTTSLVAGVIAGIFNWNGCQLHYYLATAPQIAFLGFVIGMAATFVGGFVTGRLAGRDPILHGAATGILMTAFTVLTWQNIPAAWAIAALLFTTPSAVMGAAVAAQDRAGR